MPLLYFWQRMKRKNAEYLKERWWLGSDFHVSFKYFPFYFCFESYHWSNQKILEDCTRCLDNLVTDVKNKESYNHLMMKCPWGNCFLNHVFLKMISWKKLFMEFL